MANDEMNLNEILKIRREKLEQLKEMGRNPFEILKYDQTHHSKDIKGNFEEMEGKDVSIAGRIMSFRDMGKASFCDIQDRYGKIQVYIKQDELGEEEYKIFKSYDIGDIVGIKGFVFRTKRGEISVHAKQVILLCKSCLLYTSDAADDLLCVDLGGRRIIKKKKKKSHTIMYK